MLPTEAIPQIEGLVGMILRESTDTAGTVPQEAARWLDAVKAEIRRLDPGDDVRIVGVDLDANADFVDIIGTAYARLLGCVFRNGDAEINWFRVAIQDTTAMTTTTSGSVVFNLPVAARVAANQPSYGFVTVPGGIPAITANDQGISIYAQDQFTLAVAGTGVADGSAWVVFTV